MAKRSSKSSKNPAAAQGLRVIRDDAAGIDVGSREHYVAVPPGRAAQPVRKFGCMTAQLRAMALWLKECGVTTVAMESTGVYWMPVAQMLEQYRIEVKLVDARQAMRVPGRKTDVLDCQWLQELHACGLLTGAFRPERQIQMVRTLWRHREGLVAGGAQQIHLMHKALEQMNLQLHKAISDVAGETGLRILRAIAAGERDAAKLADRCDPRIKSSRETIIQALTGDYRADHLFTLRQALEL